MDLIYNKILHGFNLIDYNIINVYMYGSRAFGCEDESSDWDVTIIVSNDCKVTECEVSIDNIDANIHTRSEFEKLIREHDPRALISIFLPKALTMKHTHDFSSEFQLDIDKLRDQISRLSEKAFACANIHNTREGLVKKSLKNIVQSYRYLQFGAQIIQYNRIIDFKCANDFHRRVMNCEKENWDDIKKLFKPDIMEISKEFRKLCPDKVHTEKRKQRKSRKNRPSKGVVMYRELGYIVNYKLNDSILINIFEQLRKISKSSIIDLSNCRLVNKKWKTVIDCNSYFLNKSNFDLG